MQKYIGKTLFFICPIIFIFILIEIYLYFSPSGFNGNAFYLKNNNDIECLFFGTSHMADAIVAKDLDLKSCNLAYGQQDYQLNTAIFLKHAPKLKNLKYVFLETDYHSFEKVNSPDYFRLAWYYKFYNVTLPGTPLYKKIYYNSLLFSSPTFFEQSMVKTIPRDIKNLFYKADSIRRDAEDDSGLFKDNNYDEDKIVELYKLNKNTVKDRDMEKVKFNMRKISEIITYCQSHHINVILLKTPLYRRTYGVKYKVKMIDRDEYVEQLKSEFEFIKIVDYESSDVFGVKDFRDGEHLNKNGARKYTAIINTLIKNNFEGY